MRTIFGEWWAAEWVARGGVFEEGVATSWGTPSDRQRSDARHASGPELAYCTTGHLQAPIDTKFRSAESSRARAVTAALWPGLRWENTTRHSVPKIEMPDRLLSMLIIRP
jgi:hypothetical protein